MVKTMFLLICFMFGSGNSPAKIDTYYCDLCIHETYSKYNLEEPDYEELIFYEWSEDYNRYHVIHYVLVGSDVIYFDPEKKIYIIKLTNGRKIKIVSKLFQSAYTIGESDLERQNKKLFPEKFRKTPWKK